MNNIRWRDFDLSFAPNIQGNLLVKTNNSSLKQRLRTVLISRAGDFPFHPEKGAGLADILFQNYDESMISLAEEKARNSIRFMEPAVEILNLNITIGDDHEIIFYCLVREIASEEEVEFQTIIGRVR